MVPVNFSFHRSIFQYYLSGSEVLSNYRSVDAGMAETRANNALASREFQTKQPAQRKVTVAIILNIKWVSVDRKKNGRRYHFYPFVLPRLNAHGRPICRTVLVPWDSEYAAMLFNPTVYLIHQHYPLACRNLLWRACARVCPVNIDAPLGTGAEKIKVS